MRSVGRRRSTFLAVLLAVFTMPATAAAQDGFMFRPPMAGVTLRAGGLMYTASSDVFEDMMDHLTLSRRDFRAPTVGVEVAFMPLSRFDLVLGAARAQSRAWSEFRDWVEMDEDGNELPIEQSTYLRTMPITASVRYQLLPRGRSVSSLAWLPRRTTPYIGAGVGATLYKLQQRGDLVDLEDLSIFFATIETTGTAFTVHGMAGVDYWLSPHFGLNAEARYTHGQAMPDSHQGFRSFDSVDLGGLQFTLGLSARW